MTTTPDEPGTSPEGIPSSPTTINDDDDNIVLPDVDEEDAPLEASVDTTDPEETTTPPGEIDYDQRAIEFRGTPLQDIRKLLVDEEAEIGPKRLDAAVRTIGSWPNILYRMIMEPNYEEMRAQTALSKLTPEDLEKISSVYRNEEGKVVLKTNSLIKSAKQGEMRHLTGPEAILAFECQEAGGGYRIPLYNSGLTIDVLAPTGTDLEMMLANCRHLDKEMGSSLGAHYFTYNDTMFKTQVLNFLQPLIINSSYNEWKKKERLWAAIRLPDLTAIVATLAHICYPDGYENFVISCKRPVSEEHPTLCNHVEKLTADISKMIVTRWASMSKEAIEHMTAARNNAKHSATQIAKYQNSLGFEGERITFGNTTFVMKVPSLTEHLEAGAQFMADIINEVEGDNTQGREEQVGVRYMRTFVPWVGSIEIKNTADSGYTTSDANVIVRALEKIDEKHADNKAREQFIDFVGRSQLTYVGHPILPCPACNHVSDTPSGMWTFDPFSTFFTLAFLYSKRNDSSTTQMV